MKTEQIVKDLVELALTDDDHYFELVKAIAILFPKNLIEQLEQLVNGPVWDGDIIGKCYRDTLIDMGVAVRVCCKGGQGFTGAYYIGYSILQSMEEMGSRK